MKIFLTGSTGYLGHEIAIKLAKQKHTIHVLVRSIYSEKIPKHKRIVVFKGDLNDCDALEIAMNGCSSVIHTAAFTNMKSQNFEEYYNGNVTCTENVLRIAHIIGIEKFIYTSTLAVFGPSLEACPIRETQPRIQSYRNDYELTKAIAEVAVLKYSQLGLDCCILNVSRIYGPGSVTFSNGVNNLILKIQKEKFLIMPAKMAVTTNYVYIEDVVNAHVRALEAGKSGERYIIAGENLSYKDLLILIKNLTKSKIKIVQIDYQISRNVCAILKLITYIFKIPSIYSPKLLDSLFTNRIADSQKARLHLDYRTTPFRSGIIKTLNFQR